MSILTQLYLTFDLQYTGLAYILHKLAFKLFALCHFYSLVSCEIKKTKLIGISVVISKLVVGET